MIYRSSDLWIIRFNTDVKVLLFRRWILFPRVLSVRIYLAAGEDESLPVGTGGQMFVSNRRAETRIRCRHALHSGSWVVKEQRVRPAGSLTDKNIFTINNKLIADVLLTTSERPNLLVSLTQSCDQCLSHLGHWLIDWLIDWFVLGLLFVSLISGVYVTWLCLWVWTDSPLRFNTSYLTTHPPPPPQCVGASLWRGSVLTEGGLKPAAAETEC